MKTYLDFLQYILTQGTLKKDRTGTGTFSVFGQQMRFDLSRGFPLITTKKIHLKSVVHELLWFLQGDTNARYLQEHGVKIWDEWADKTGELGPIYGKQWRRWETADGRVVDQMSEVINTIKTQPHSRRLLVSAWNVGELEHMALPPCHLLFQFYVADNKLSCQLYQRSADAFLGVPFNIASYALLTHLIAAECGLGVGDFVWTGGDCHVYTNHVAQVQVQVSRQPYALPTLQFKKRNSIFDYQFEDFEFIDYQCHPAIKAPVAV